MLQKKIRIIDLLYPHWGTLSLAFIAVLGESITDLLEPWPLKIVFDYVFGSKRMPDWLASSVSYIGTDKFSILNFAVLAVIVIAIFGAVSSYVEKYLRVWANGSCTICGACFTVTFKGSRFLITIKNALAI